MNGSIKTAKWLPLPGSSRWRIAVFGQVPPLKIPLDSSQLPGKKAIR